MPPQRRRRSRVCAVGAAGLIEQLLRVILREDSQLEATRSMHSLNKESASSVAALFHVSTAAAIPSASSGSLRRPVEQHCRALYASERAAGGTGLNIVHRIVEHDAEGGSGFLVGSRIGCAHRCFNCRGGSLGCGSRVNIDDLARASPPQAHSASAIERTRIKANVFFILLPPWGYVPQPRRGWFSDTTGVWKNQYNFY